MSKIIKLNKGLDIKLEGQAASVGVNAPLADMYAVSPLDFEGVTPKLLVKAGDQVKAGTPLFFNKYNERVLFTSPVSGTVEAVNRGEKRKVLSVTVKPDAEQQYEEFAIPDLSSATRDQIVGLLLKAGLWTMIILRPYGLQLRARGRKGRLAAGRGGIEETHGRQSARFVPCGCRRRSRYA